MRFARKLFKVGTGILLVTAWQTIALAQQAQSVSNRADSYIAPGTLAYHLSTNAAGRAEGLQGGYNDTVEYTAPASTNLDHLTNASWSTHFWLKGVHGLSATPIGFSNVLGGQGLPTMVSPRHYLCSTHMHAETYTIAFLDTNNVVHWRRTLQRVDIPANEALDTSVGILDKDLPPSVGYLPVVPANYSNYIPLDSSVVQGIGMNQDFRLFGQPMSFHPGYVTWSSSSAAPFGLATNWNVTIRGGDSSSPDMLLIGNQLILASHTVAVMAGPNYATQIGAINHQMHYLSTNNRAGTDYQLTQFPLTNWPVIHN